MNVSYFILKWEFNFVDNLDKAAALSTDQIDIENAERYDITYVEKLGEKQHPLILHCSPSGAIERCVYALLEKAYRDQQKGNVSILPLWLSPIQVRVIPISDKFIDDAKNVFEQIKNENYDLAVFTIASMILEHDLKICNLIKNLNPSCLTVGYSWYARKYSKEILDEYKNIDVLIIEDPFSVIENLVTTINNNENLRVDI